jgi:hypothetical protein
MTAPNRETDDVGDRVLKSFIQGFLPPSPTDIKDATSWGVMPHQMATKMASDFSTQLTVLQAQTGLSRKELLLKIGKEMVFSPEGVGTMLGMLFPTSFKGGAFIPRRLRPWVRKATELGEQEFKIATTLTEDKLAYAMKQARLNRHTGEYWPGMKPDPDAKGLVYERPIGQLKDYVLSNTSRSMLGDYALDAPVVLTRRLNSPFANLGEAAPYKILLPDSKRTGKFFKQLDELYKVRTSPTGKIESLYKPMFQSPLVTALHEGVHIAQNGEGIRTNWARPWNQRPTEATANRLANLLYPTEILDKRTLAHFPRIPGVIDPMDFYYKVDKGKGVNWVRR